MKRILILFLCLSLLLGLIACGKATNPNNNQYTESTDLIEPKNLLISKTIIDADVIIMEEHYKYTANGHLSEIIENRNGIEREYTVKCDSNGNPIRITNGTLTRTLTYNELGQLQVYDYGHGVFFTYTYDENNLLIKEESFAAGEKISYTLYTYDAEGKEIKAETYGESRFALSSYTLTEYEETDSGYIKTSKNYCDGSSITTIFVYEVFPK